MKSFLVTFKKYLLIIFVFAVISLGLFYYNNYIYKPDYSYDYGIPNFEEDLGEVSEDGYVADVIREFLPLSQATLSNQRWTISLNRFEFEKELVLNPPKEAKLDDTVLFYVEYEARSGKNNEERKTLFKRKNEGNYEIVAMFSKKRNKWELELGEDLLLGRELVLYEKVNGQWAKY